MCVCLVSVCRVSVVCLSVLTGIELNPLANQTYYQPCVADRSCYQPCMPAGLWQTGRLQVCSFSLGAGVLVLP